MKNLTFLFLFIYACGSSIPESKNKIDYNSIENYSSRMNSETKKIVFDTITITIENENELNSMDGDFFFFKDTICFADRSLASIFMYDLNGQFLKTKIQKGKGPNEILDLKDITQFDNKNYAIMGSQWDIYIFDSLWVKKDEFRINWNPESMQSMEDLKNNPDPNNPGIYEAALTFCNLHSIGDNYILFPIVTNHFKYNGIMPSANIDHFYENSYTLGIVDIKKREVADMMCNRSPIYSKYKYLSKFKNIIFDTNENTLYYTFQADSLIYQYNLKNSTICSFGHTGYDMNTNYEGTSTIEEYQNQATLKFGFYTDLMYEKETKTLFRSFHRGDPSRTSGLQVYRDQKLIREFDVPNLFNVIGYVEPYYYGYGEHNYEKGEMYIYRFKL